MVRSGDVRRVFPGAWTTLFTHCLISFTAIDKEVRSVNGEAPLPKRMPARGSIGPVEVLCYPFCASTL